jgi:hypothetical protein
MLEIEAETGCKEKDLRLNLDKLILRKSVLIFSNIVD